MRRLLILILLTLLGCNDSATVAPPQSTSAPVSEASTKLQVGSRLFTLEIADDHAERQKGLMYRNELPPGTGMIFVFPDERERGFWMKNTYIPLEIVYIDAAGKIVSIKRMEPHDQRNTSSDFPAKYAIELNIGDTASAGLSVGQVLVIPPELRMAAR